MYVEVDWETDGEEVDLPKVVQLPLDLEVTNEAICKYLSDTYGWLVNNWRYHVAQR